MREKPVASADDFRGFPSESVLSIGDVKMSRPCFCKLHFIRVSDWIVGKRRGVGKAAPDSSWMRVQGKRKPCGRTESPGETRA
jgi:hypothetical protein